MTDRLVEEVARCFHKQYERLAPSYGFASPSPWVDVAVLERELTVAAMRAVLDEFPLACAAELDAPGPEGLDEGTVKRLVEAGWRPPPYRGRVASAAGARDSELDAPGPDGRWTLLAPHTELDRDPATWQVLRVVGPKLERESVEVVVAASPSTEGRAGEGIASESQPPERVAKDSQGTADAPSPAGPSTEGLTETEVRAVLQWRRVYNKGVETTGIPVDADVAQLNDSAEAKLRSRLSGEPE